MSVTQVRLLHAELDRFDRLLGARVAGGEVDIPNRIENPVRAEQVRVDSMLAVEACMAIGAFAGFAVVYTNGDGVCTVIGTEVTLQQFVARWRASSSINATYKRMRVEAKDTPTELDTRLEAAHRVRAWRVPIDEITHKVAELFPDLVVGPDADGEPLLTPSGGQHSLGGILFHKV